MTGAGQPWLAVLSREFRSYFATPLAAVFLVVFLFLAGVFSFSLGGLYERGQADLRPFFDFAPWLLLFLAPALSMRLWAEERRLGTIELLITLPIPLTQVVLGKFLAAWAFSSLAIIGTVPLWLTVSWLGDPDQGTIVAGMLATILLAGLFLSVGGVVSALTKNQVIAFVVSMVACFLLMVSGFPVVLDFLEGWVPEGVLDAVASVSVLTHFSALTRGVLDVRDVVYFLLGMAAMVLSTAFVIDWKKGS